MRTCGKRNKGGKVDGICFVVDCVRIRRERNKILFSVLRCKKSVRDFVGREKRTRRAKFRSHIGNGCPLRYGKRFHSFAAVLKNGTDAALDVQSAKDLKDDILGADIVGKFACKLNADTFRHGDIIGAAAHCDRNVKSAGTHAEHPDAAQALVNHVATRQIQKAERRRSSIRPLTVRRTGSVHDGALEPGAHPSASAIRALLRDGETERALSLLPPAMAKVYREEAAAGRAPVFAETCQRALLARLRTMTESDFAALDQGREGLCRRLWEASRSAVSVEEILSAAKTKRYAYARLRRMVLWAYLGLTPADVPAAVPYLRPLAANDTGRRLLSAMRRQASVPILTKPADVRALGPEARRLLALEARATDLYTLAYPALSAAQGGGEWREGPVILGGPPPC